MESLCHKIRDQLYDPIVAAFVHLSNSFACKKHLVYVDDMTSSAKLRQLRHAIGKTQQEFAAIAGCTRHTIESVEIGRLKISAKLALKIQRACGVDSDWLLNGDQEPIRNEYGEPWALKDFEACQARDETMTFRLAEEEMKIAVAYDRLCRVYREDRATHTVPGFIHALEDFVRRQVHRFPHLRDQVEQERTTCDPYLGKPRSYLSPAGTAGFKRSRKRLNEAIATFSAWEKRMAFKKSIGEKVRENRVKNPDTIGSRNSRIKSNKSRQK